MYWGVPICRVLFCLKLLGDDNFQDPVLCQIIGEYNLQGLASCQTIGEFQFERFCVVSSLWGVPTCSALCCPKLFWRFLSVVKFSGGFQFARSCLTSGYRGITICKVLFCSNFMWVNFMGVTKGAIPSNFLNTRNHCGSPYNLKTPLHVATPVHHIS